MFKMVNKRGQVTIFIIVGIVILFLFAAYLYMSQEYTVEELSSESKDAGDFQLNKLSLISYVEDCIEETISPAIDLLAIQGGLIYQEEDSLILLTDDGMINYAYLNGMKGIQNNKMEKDLNFYLEENIILCLGGYEQFAEQLVKVEPNFAKIKANTIISKSKITANLEFPHKVTLTNDKTFSVNTFSKKINVPLGDLLEEVEDVIDNNKGKIDLNHLNNLDFYPVVFPYDEKTQVYSLTYESNNEVNQKNEEKDLTFMFAVREDDNGVNAAPKLHFVADKTFRVGDQWEEKFIAEDNENDQLTYSWNNNQFKLSEEGEVSSIITTTGTHKITLIVEDADGLKDSIKFEVTILENYDGAIDLIDSPVEELPEELPEGLSE